jgi:hypothetical protein
MLEYVIQHDCVERIAREREVFNGAVMEGEAQVLTDVANHRRGDVRALDLPPPRGRRQQQGSFTRSDVQEPSLAPYNGLQFGEQFLLNTSTLRLVFDRVREIIVGVDLGGRRIIKKIRVGELKSAPAALDDAIVRGCENAPYVRMRAVRTGLGWTHRFPREWASAQKMQTLNGR